MKISATRLALASFWLISGLITVELNNIIPVVAENPSTFPHPQSIPERAITVTQTEFGMKSISSKGKITILPTSKVRLREGDAYGWRIHLQNYQGEIEWREVLHLPKAPQTWGTEFGDNFSISADGTTATSKRKETVSNGVIENFWTIASGDPTGKHIIEVYAGNQLLATFEFDVFAVKKV